MAENGRPIYSIYGNWLNYRAKESYYLLCMQIIFMYINKIGPCGSAK